MVTIMSSSRRVPADAGRAVSALKVSQFLVLHVIGARGLLPPLPCQVTKWTGSAWTRLISGANNLPPVYSTSNIANIAISSNGDVFIAYPNQSYENLVFRLPAGTSTWEQLGVAGDLTPAGAGASYYLSLAIDPKGTPYIMVTDVNSNLFAYSWDGSAWTQLGSSSPARGFYFSFALFGPQQIPSFAYADYTTSYPCYMQYY